MDQPYRTGIYLIYDYHPGDDDHFRRGDDTIKIQPPTFRASGSRQLDAKQLADRLREVGDKAKQAGGKLYVFDLRQETHIFYVLKPYTDLLTNGRAVSWYADKDWANVGQSPNWINAEEESELNRILISPTTQIFTISKGVDDHVTPVSFSEVTVNKAATEATVVTEIGTRLSLKTNYYRLPNSDHCPPTDSAVEQLIKMVFEEKTIDPGNDWVHFHCHGGDGRTTTFLTIWDMIYQKVVNKPAPFPPLDWFVHRQCELFNYSLTPNEDCKGKKTYDPYWKQALAGFRWRALLKVREWIAAAPGASIQTNVSETGEKP